MSQLTSLQATASVSDKAVEDAIIRTVAYVDMFDYPLTAIEVHRFLEGVRTSYNTVTELLRGSPRVRQYVCSANGYFMLAGRESIAQIRKRREAISRELWPSAQHYGRWMAAMPFVRMVSVTGSLAVRNAEADADIDYLLITANDRLWLSRAFVILVVRLAARRSIALCPNYLLAERALRFGDRNLYTAHELAQMVPLHGLSVFRRLLLANKWAYDRLPNARQTLDVGTAVDSNGHSQPSFRFQPFVENVLNVGPAEGLEQWEMGRKVKKLQSQSVRNEANTQEAQFSANWCKGHFEGHANVILANYRQRLAKLDMNP